MERANAKVTEDTEKSNLSKEQKWSAGKAIENHIRHGAGGQVGTEGTEKSNGTLSRLRNRKPNLDKDLFHQSNFADGIVSG